MKPHLTVERVRELSLLLLPPIFRACLADKDGRFSLSAPFLCGDHVCATDSRIMVRQPATPIVAELIALGPDRKLPKSPDVFGTWKHRETPTPLPDDLPGETQCRQCDGEGVEHCEYCDSPGPCGACGGRGLGLDPEVDVWLAPKVLIGLEYAWILKHHRAAIYLPTDPPDKPVRFTVGEAEGLLMCKKLPEDRRL